MIRLSLVLATILFSAGAVQAAPCALDDSLGYREFTLPRNSLCLIKKNNIPGSKLVSVKITVQPKLGKFGSASATDFAYRAGRVVGDDHFEYTSTESQTGGPALDYPTINVVHITP
jgi:hypothetical protein